MTGLLNFPCTVFAGVSVADKDVRRCARPLPLFLGLDVLIGFAHVCFALYLQNRIISGAQEEQLDLLGAFHLPLRRGNSSTLLKRAGELIIFDVCFLLYTLFFIGAFIFNVVGNGWIKDCKPTSWMPEAAVIFSFLFLSISFAIAMFWCFVLARGRSRPIAPRPPQQQTSDKYAADSEKHAADGLEAPDIEPRAQQDKPDAGRRFSAGMASASASVGAVLGRVASTASGRWRNNSSYKAERAPAGEDRDDEFTTVPPPESPRAPLPPPVPPQTAPSPPKLPPPMGSQQSWTPGPRPAAYDTLEDDHRDDADQSPKILGHEGNAQ